MIKRNTLVLGACLTLTSLGVSAQTAVEGDIEASTDGYINVGGQVLKTGLGECLQSGSLNDDNIINQCAGIEEEAVEEAVETVEAVEEAPKAPVVQTAKIDTRDFSELALFNSNSATLNAEGGAAMQSLFEALSQYKGITKISVIGHTDSLGDEAYNQALSEQRAATVAAQISTKYPDASIDVKGMGESSPIATNSTAEGRQQNRRVEIEVTASRMTFN